MVGFWTVEVKRSGPDQEKVAPDTEVVKFNTIFSPSQIARGPLKENFGTGEPVKQVALLKEFLIAFPGKGPKPRFRLIAPLL